MMKKISGSLENINIYFERERDKLPEMISKFSDKRIGDFKKLVKFPLSAINSETTIFDLLSTGLEGTLQKMNLL